MTVSALAPGEITALAEALRPSILRLSRRLRQEAHKAGVSAADAVLLALVKAQPGIGVSALADAEQTSRPTMSGHLKRLEAAGLVVRDADEDDARRSGFTITRIGARKLDQIRAQRNDWLARRLARLSEAERQQLSAAVEPLLRLASVES